MATLLTKNNTLLLHGTKLIGILSPITNLDLSTSIALPQPGNTVPTVFDAEQYSGTISWLPNDSVFKYSTTYTASVVLTPKTGFTVNGIAANVFTLDGANTITNTANSGNIEINFPITSTDTSWNWALSSTSANNNVTCRNIGTDFPQGSGTNSVYTVGTLSNGTIGQLTTSETTGYVAKVSNNAYSWVTALGGEPLAATSDYNHNVYVLGGFTDAVTLGATNLTGSGYNFYLVKLNSSGIIQWAIGTTTGGASSMMCKIMAALNSIGNSMIYIGATFNQQVTLGATTLTASSMSGFVAKVDENGNWIWAKSIGSDYSTVRSLVVSYPDTAITVTGQFKDTITLGSTTLTGISTSASSFVARLNNAGDWQWAIAGDASLYSYGLDVTLSSYLQANDPIYVTGVYQGTMSLGGTSLPMASYPSTYVAKLNSTGAIMWTQTTDGTNNHTLGIACNYAPEIYTLVECIDPTGFGTITNMTGLVLAKIDNTTGNWIWAKSLGTPAAYWYSTYRAGGIVIKKSNAAVIVAGEYGNLTLGSTNLTGPVEGQLAYIAEYQPFVPN